MYCKCSTFAIQMFSVWHGARDASGCQALVVETMDERHPKSHGGANTEHSRAGTEGRICIVCAQGFVPSSGRQLTCSRECRQIHRKRLRHLRWARLSREEQLARRAKDNAHRLPKVHHCRRCGEEFHPRSDSQDYCSRECVADARRKVHEPAPVVEPADPEAEAEWKAAVAELRATSRRIWHRRSRYADELERLGLPRRTYWAAEQLGISHAALAARIRRHIHTNPKKLLAPARPYRRQVSRDEPKVEASSVSSRSRDNPMTTCEPIASAEPLGTTVKSVSSLSAVSAPGME